MPSRRLAPDLGSSPSSACVWAALLLALAGCDQSAADPAVPSGAAKSTASASAAAAATATITSSASASAPYPPSSASESAPAPGASASAASSAVAMPAVLAEDGSPLPQTKDRPEASSAVFRAKLDLLFKAIVAGDPEIAKDAFFPVVAYEQVKDIKKPKSDWTHRLMKNFSRDILAYHKDLGAGAAKAKLVGVEIDEHRVKWMDKGKEGNKLGYYRVTRSHLVYEDERGAKKKLEITSLISWRGEWFIVHLHGFK